MRNRGVPKVEELPVYWDGDKVQMYKGLHRKVIGILGMEKWICEHDRWIVAAK